MILAGPWKIELSHEHCVLASFDLFRRFCKSYGRIEHAMLLSQPVPLLALLAGTQERSEYSLFLLLYGSSSEKLTIHSEFCRETSSQLIIWSWSQKWIHFHFLGLPLKLLREDNYFPSSNYFLTSFSWKWQSSSAPGWQIQPWFDKCNSEHSPDSLLISWLRKLCKVIVTYFWQTTFSFNFRTKRKEMVQELFQTRKPAWRWRSHLI